MTNPQPTRPATSITENKSWKKLRRFKYVLSGTQHLCVAGLRSDGAVFIFYCKPEKENKVLADFVRLFTNEPVKTEAEFDASFEKERIRNNGLEIASNLAQ